MHAHTPAHRAYACGIRRDIGCAKNEKKPQAEQLRPNFHSKTEGETLKSAYDHGCFVIFWRIPSSTALSLSVTAVGRALNPLRCLLGLHPNSPKT